MKHKIIEHAEFGYTRCDKCKSWEGEMTTDCIGVEMTESQKRNVLSGKVDFKNGNWIDINYSRTHKNTN